MRLWTIHPKYLDAKGLVAVWREGLLAQAVLRGKTRGYRHHPQLTRFQASRRPVAVIARYLAGVHEESVSRGYRFDASRIARSRLKIVIESTEGQLSYEWRHLKEKLRVRSPEDHLRVRNVDLPEPHPMFDIVEGDIEDWERR